MSDRDEVRKLAEEILRLAGPTTHLNYPAQLDKAERRLLAFLAQREATDWQSEYVKVVARYDDVVTAIQAQLHRALGEGARLREALSLVAPITAEALSASPLSERAGAVIGDSLACHDAGLSFSSEDSEELVWKWKDSVAKLSHELSFGGQR